MRNINFIITIDTEGDNCWRTLSSRNSVNNRITTKNGRYVGRFQRLCEKYGFKVTYLVNYEMCMCEPFVEMATCALKRGMCEIGMHVHGWNSPPFYDLPRGTHPKSHNAYIGEYPEDVIAKKVNFLKNELEGKFDVDVVSHRSGRWYMDSAYLKIIKDQGLMIDCSVTPGISWETSVGRIDGSIGTNYKEFPNSIYEIDINNPSSAGESGLYEIPVTTGKRVINEMEEYFMFRPTGSNIESLIQLVNYSLDSEYIEFMLHSSELMPNGSPNFRTEWDVEKLYQDIDNLFNYISQFCTGVTLNEYLKRYLEK